MFLALYIEPAWLAEADRAFVDCAAPGFFPRAGIQITNEINRLRSNLVRRMADPHDQHDELQESILELCLNVSHTFSDWRDRGAALRKPHSARDYRVGRALRHMRERASEAVDVCRQAANSHPEIAHYVALLARATLAGSSPDNSIGLSPTMASRALLASNAFAIPS